MRLQVEEFNEEKECLHAGIQAKVVDIEVQQYLKRQVTIHASTQFYLKAATVAIFGFVMRALALLVCHKWGGS